MNHNARLNILGSRYLHLRNLPRRNLVFAAFLILIFAFTFFNCFVYVTVFNHNQLSTEKNFNLSSTQKIINMQASDVLTNSNDMQQGSGMHVGEDIDSHGTRRDKSRRPLWKFRKREIFRMLMDGPTGLEATACTAQASILPRGMTTPNWPANPQYLLKELAPHYQDTGTQGAHRPANCRARQAIALLLLYHQGQTTLNDFFARIVPYLARQMLDFTIYLVQQTQGSPYNPGALLNAAFLQAESIKDYDCFILQDADSISLDDTFLYTCSPDHPRWLLPDVKQDQSNPRENRYAGILLFTRPQFIKANGVSNHCLQNIYDISQHLRSRFRHRGLSVDTEVSRVQLLGKALENGIDLNDKEHQNCQERTDSSSDDHLEQDGLSSVLYKLVDRYIGQLYIELTLDLRHTEIATITK